MKLHTQLGRLRELEEAAHSKSGGSVKVPRELLRQILMDHHGLVSEARSAGIRLDEPEEPRRAAPGISPDGRNPNGET